MTMTMDKNGPKLSRRGGISAVSGGPMLELVIPGTIRPPAGHLQGAGT
jgi:hypothetical protein